MRLIDADALKKDRNMGNKCEDCPRDARDCQYGMVLTRMDVCGMLDDAPTVEMPGWVSVKDRLPENDNEVITAYRIDDEKAMKKRKGKLFVKTGNWTGHCWISVWDEYKSYAIEEEVLYWMPLPEPPKEGEVE